jgi:hypothetical protein
MMGGEEARTLDAAVVVVEEVQEDGKRRRKMATVHQSTWLIYVLC